MDRRAPSRWGRASPAAAGRWWTGRPAPRGGWSGPSASRAVRSSAYARPPSYVGPQPAAQRLLAGVQLVDGHELLLLVREHRVAGTVVHGRDAQGGEAGDVGPAELRVDRAADGVDE